MSAPTDSEDEYDTGVRRIATVNQWKALVEQLRSWAKQARGLEMMTGDVVIDAIAEVIENVRDQADQHLTRRRARVEKVSL